MATWLGSTKCDFCGDNMKEEPVGSRLYDARTKHGPWATMCPTCWIEQTYQRLGTGLGQGYVMDPDGKYRKIEG